MDVVSGLKVILYTLSSVCHFTKKVNRLSAVGRIKFVSKITI
mgnify:FL=1